MRTVLMFVDISVCVCALLQRFSVYTRANVARATNVV